MEEKKLLRKRMSDLRSAMDPDARNGLDKAMNSQLAGLIAEKRPGVVHTYLPMGSEINIFPLIQQLLDDGITVVTPKALKQRKMQNLILHSLSALEDGIYGTQHPAGGEEYTGKFDLFVIPGLAFDAECYRLGYGSGYYDSFLHTQPDAIKLGICYPFQVVDKVPTEPHDVRLDLIFS